jgi:glucose-1-phosphate adenylyltransferase
MDFRQLLRTHLDSRADVTIAVLPVTQEQAVGCGILRLDDAGRVVGFCEKPQTEEQLAPLVTPAEWMERRGINSRGRPYLASMGIYLFNRQALFDLLAAMLSATDFGKHIFPASIQTHRVQAHLFDGYWEDLGTVKAFHEANLALASDNPPFDFHSPEGVIYTRMRYLPASRISASHLEHCLISDGCVVESDARLERCVVGVRSRIGRNVTVRDTVIIGADHFETEGERTANLARGLPNLGVGDGTIIERAILDKDCRIGRNVQIVNRRNLQEHETDRYVIRDGVVVIPKGTVVPDGMVI